MKKLNQKMKLFTPIFLVLGVLSTNVHAQSGVSINNSGAAPDADAVLDISSLDKGVLLPRVADHTALTPNVGGDYGLVVFKSTTTSYLHWSGTSW